MKKTLPLLALMVVLGACEKQPEYIMDETAFCGNRRELACKDNKVFCEDYTETFICEDAEGKPITGHVVAWYSNGNKYADLFVKNGLGTGKFSYFKPNGDLEQTGAYKNGKLHGMVKEFYKGKVTLLTKYKNGEDIESTKYDHNGSVIGRVYSENDITRIYDGDGRLVSESKENIVTKNESNKIEKKYDENGALTEIKYYTVYTQDKAITGYIGVSDNFSKSDVLVGIEEYKNGKLDGQRLRAAGIVGKKNILYTEQWENGKLEGVVTRYIGDEVVRKIYYKNGIKRSEESYSGGALVEKKFYNGKFNYVGHFYPDGKPKSEEFFEYKDPYGPQKTFYPNGQIANEHSYKNGDLDGVERYYSENGELELEITYKDGKLDEKDMKKLMEYGSRKSGDIEIASVD